MSEPVQPNTKSGVASDDAIRQEVLDPTRSFIVQAPAGSGKTELLVQRLLTLLARVNKPGQIVAITFTRKAAAEMRERVMKALRMAANEPRPSESHAVRTWELGRRALARDAECGWNLLSDPGQLALRTIDSFNASLVRQMPISAAYGGGVEPTGDAKVLYRAAAQRTVREWAESPCADALSMLLGRRDNRVSEFIDLVAKMLSKREQWLPYVADGQMPSRASIETLLNELVCDHLAVTRKALEQVYEPAELSRLVSLLAQIAAARSEPTEPLSEWCSAGALPSADEAGYRAWCALPVLILTDKGTVRKKWGPASTGTSDKKTNQAFAVLMAQLAAHPVAVARVHHLRALPEPNYVGDQWAAVEAMFAVLNRANEHLLAVLDESETADYTAISLRAQAALGAEFAPTELALRLDYDIIHLLVDEFQDTSHLQYELLTRLTREWMPGDGKTLFLVGDPMQSIYRFRKAEVGLFLKAMQEGIGGVHLEARRLEANFRSQAGIVDWVNATFAQVFPPTRDALRGAIDYAPSVAQKAPAEGPAVTLHPAVGKGWLEEAQSVVEVVRASLAETAPGEAPESAKVAVLVRSRTHLRVITKALEAAGIACNAVRIERLGDRPEVRDLSALTRALLHPADRPAWLAVLRAPWCGLLLRDLVALVAGGRDESVWDLLCNEDRLARLTSGGADRARQLRRVLASVYAERGSDSLGRWVLRAWRRLGGPVAYGVETAELDRITDAFLNTVEELSKGGDLADLGRLESRLADQHLAPGNTASAPVHLMTIHSAKGLQYDTVLLPGLGRTPAHDSKELLSALEVPSYAAGKQAMGLLLSPLGRRDGTESPRLQAFVASIESERARNEVTRLLYVAATRAVNRLHLFGNVRLNKAGEANQPTKTTLLARLWPAIREGFEARREALPPPPEVDVANPAPPAPRPPLSRLPVDWELPAAPAPALPLPPAPEGRKSVYLWAGQTAAHVGTVTHAFLERMANEGLSDWDAAALDGCQAAVSRQLVFLGVGPDELAAATDKVLKALKRTLEDPQGRFLLGAHAHAENEWELTAELDGNWVNVTLDRSFVDGGGVRWIVDWKTSSHEGQGADEFLDQEAERYTAQLQNYARVLSKLERRPQKLVLYFPLMQAQREVPLPPLAG